MKHNHQQFTPAAAYRGKDVAADRVRRFVPMVRKAAWHIHGSGRAGLDVEDLMQAGFVALTECARNHEGPGEDGFAAYAKIRVRGAMFDLVRKQMLCSRNAAQRKQRAEQVARRFYQREGRDPSRSELADALGIADDALDLYLGEEIQLLSMDDSYDDSSAAFACGQPDPFAVLCELRDSERLGKAVEQLPQRLQLVLQLYFAEELNLTEIAEVLEISVPRVHQLKAQALSKLRILMESGDD